MVSEAVKKNENEVVDRLWALYRENSSKENRNKLVSYYLPYVKAIAIKIMERLPKNALELDDLVNAGIFGLVDAIEKFDDSKGVKFSVYSYTKINGSILDELRKLDCISYVGRNLAHKIESAYEELYKQFGREPNVQDIARYLKIDESEVKEGLSIISRINLAGRKYFYLNDSRSDNYVELTEVLEDKSIHMKKDFFCDALKKYVKESFSTFEQLIFTLYFESNLTLTQIAKMFEYSPSRITDIFNNILLRLRNHIRLLLEKYNR